MVAAVGWSLFIAEVIQETRSAPETDPLSIWVKEDADENAAQFGVCGDENEFGYFDVTTDIKISHAGVVTEQDFELARYAPGKVHRIRIDTTTGSRVSSIVADGDVYVTYYDGDWELLAQGDPAEVGRIITSAKDKVRCPDVAWFKYLDEGRLIGLYVEHYVSAGSPYYRDMGENRVELNHPSEIWIDAAGRLIKQLHRKTILDERDGNVILEYEEERVYSGFGEPNEITAPLIRTVK